MAFHRRKYPVFKYKGSKTGNHSVDMVRIMVPQNGAVGQFKHPVAAVSLVKPAIPVKVAMVVVEQKIAEVENTTGSQYPPNFPHQAKLTGIGRNAGHDGDEQSGIKDIVIKRQHAVRHGKQGQAGIILPRPVDHPGGTVHAGERAKSGRIKLAENPAITAAHVEDFGRSGYMVSKPVNLKRDGKCFFVSNPIPICWLRCSHRLSFFQCFHQFGHRLFGADFIPGPDDFSLFVN